MILAHIRSSFFDAFFPRLGEWNAASVTFAIGVMLLDNPERMFADFEAYRLMLGFFSQPTWSLIFLGLGLLRLIVLTINGAWRRSPLARGVMAFLSCFPWALLVLCFASSFGFAFIMAAGYLSLDIVNVNRAMGDARTVDDALARGRKSGHE